MRRTERLCQCLFIIGWLFQQVSAAEEVPSALTGGSLLPICTLPACIRATAHLLRLLLGVGCHPSLRESFHGTLEVHGASREWIPNNVTYLTPLNCHIQLPQAVTSMYDPRIV